MNRTVFSSYDLMRSCWTKSEVLRPHFRTVEERFAPILSSTGVHLYKPVPFGQELYTGEPQYQDRVPPAEAGQLPVTILEAATDSTGGGFNEVPGSSGDTCRPVRSEFAGGPAHYGPELGRHYDNRTTGTSNPSYITMIKTDNGQDARDEKLVSSPKCYPPSALHPTCDLPKSPPPCYSTSPQQHVDVRSDDYDKPVSDNPLNYVNTSAIS